MWILIIWKEFKNRKMKDVCELADTKDMSEALTNMKIFNAQKLKTTSDYKVFDLSQLLEDKGLQIAEKITIGTSDL